MKSSQGESKELEVETLVFMVENVQLGKNQSITQNVEFSGKFLLCVELLLLLSANMFICMSGGPGVAEDSFCSLFTLDSMLRVCIHLRLL